MHDKLENVRNEVVVAEPRHNPGICKAVLRPAHRPVHIPSSHLPNADAFIIDGEVTSLWK